MAGHRRTVPGKGIDPTTGRRRRVAKPNGEAAVTAHQRRARNTRALAEQRLAAETDPLRRLDIAVGYVRSAAAKTNPNPDELDQAVAALMRHGTILMERRVA